MFNYRKNLLDLMDDGVSFDVVVTNEMRCLLLLRDPSVGSIIGLCLSRTGTILDPLVSMSVFMSHINSCRTDSSIDLTCS